MRYFLTAFFAIVCVLLIIMAVTPWGRSVFNSWDKSLQKADDATTYESLKKVEDTCRAMIASYNADKAVFEQYNESPKENEQEWAAQARMRANRTAATYNEYILKNSYVWRNNVPADIFMNLPTL